MTLEQIFRSISWCDDSFVWAAEKREIEKRQRNCLKDKRQYYFPSQRSRRHAWLLRFTVGSVQADRQFYHALTPERRRTIPSAFITKRSYPGSLDPFRTLRMKYFSNAIFARCTQ